MSSSFPAPICNELASMKRCTTRQFFEAKLEICKKIYIEKDIDSISKWDIFNIYIITPQLINSEYIESENFQKIQDKIQFAKDSLW